MHRWIRGLRAAALMAVAALTLAACGGGGDSAQSLLRQTFTGHHPINSGRLDVALSLVPSGSSTLKTPVALSLSGPFQSRGKGQLPASDFTVALTAGSAGGRLGIVSTGTAGYVTLDGASYQLPAANFKQLESSFASVASPGSGGQGSTLSRLGLQPLKWLEHPTILGTETVGGARTTHIHAGVNVQALVADLGTFLRRARSSGVSGANQLPSSLSPSTRQKLAAELRSPSVDVWTGTADRTLRRLRIAFNLPVTGSISTLLGGLSQAGVSLTLQYSDLGARQTITAPTAIKPYAQLQAKLRSLAQGLAGTVTSGTGTSGTTSTGTTGTPGATSTGATSTGAGTATGSSRYDQCMASAHGDIAKMQQCTTLMGQ